MNVVVSCIYIVASQVGGITGSVEVSRLLVLVELNVLMLLDHHVNSLLRVLEIELVELLSLTTLSLRLIILLTPAISVGTTKGCGFSLRSSSKYFLSQSHVGLVLCTSLVHSAKSVRSFMSHSLILDHALIVCH